MAEKTDAALLTLTTAEAIAQHRLTRFDSSGNLVYCDAGEFPLGPVRVYAASGVPLGIELLSNKAGTIKCMASAAITTARTPVYTAADGKVSGTNTGVLVGTTLDTASGDGSVIEVLPDLRRVPWVNTAAATVVGATSTAEHVCDKSVTIPAAELIAGSILRIRVAGLVVNQDTTPQLDVRLKVGTETIVTSTILAAATNDQTIILCDVVIRTIGSSGTLIGLVAEMSDAAGTGVVVDNKASATEDTTAGLLVSVTAQFDASHASNTWRLDILEVQHLR